MFTRNLLSVAVGTVLLAGPALASQPGKPAASNGSTPAASTATAKRTTHKQQHRRHHKQTKATSTNAAKPSR